MDANRHRDRVAVVTGVGSGIGRGVAERLAAEGAIVAGIDIDLVAGRAVVEQTHGRVDVLVCNAAVNRTPGDGRDLKDERVRQGLPPDHLVDMTDEGWARMIGVNLTGVFTCCRAALRVMNRQEHGAVVCVSSIAAQSGTGPVHYTAAKAGVIGLVRSLALEVAARGIRVNAVCPGSVDTPMMHSVPAELLDGLTARIPLGRIGRTDDIAAAIAHLTSDDAAYVTGAVVPVNGGLFIG